MNYNGEIFQKLYVKHNGLCDLKSKFPSHTSAKGMNKKVPQDLLQVDGVSLLNLDHQRMHICLSIDKNTCNVNG